MTLIALTLNHGNPVMMADLLVSSRDSDGVIETPTYVNGTGDLLTGMQGSRPMALKQKLYLINDRLCVAVAGGEDYIFTFLGKVKAFFGRLDFDVNELEKFVYEHTPEERANLSAILLASIQEGERTKFKVFVIDVKKTESELYSDVYAAGKGDIQFLKYIRKDNKFKTDIPDPVLGMNLSLFGYWLGQEIATGETLKMNWGAGYEMIYFKDGKFIKMNEYTVVFLEAQLGKDVPFNPAPILTTMFHYQGDYLVIHSHAFRKHRIFIAPRVDDDNELGLMLKDHTHAHGCLLVVYVIREVDTRMIDFRIVALPRNVNERDKTPVVIEKLGWDEIRLYTSQKQDDYILDTLTR